MIKILLVLFAFIGLSYGQMDQEFEDYLQELSSEFNINQIEADSLITQTVILLDTREKEEYMVSRIESAIWIGYDDFDLSRLRGINLEDEIVVYCSVGYRSSKIGIMLKEHGFKNVKNLYGGIFRWANIGHPLYNDTIRTNYIHTYNTNWGRFVQNPTLNKID